MNPKQKNVSALTKEQIAYIKGCSLLQTAVWRISHRDPLKAIGNTLANSIFKNAVLTMMIIREKNRKEALKATLQKWSKKVKLLNGLLNQRRVFLKFLVNSTDAKVKALLSKYLMKWISLSRQSEKDFLIKYGSLFKLLELVTKRGLKPGKNVFFSRIRNYVNRENKPVIRGLYNIDVRSKKEILRRAFYNWKNNMKSNLMNIIKRRFLALAIKSSLKRNGREACLKALRKWNKNAQKDRLFKDKLGYVLLSVYSKWSKFNKTTAILTGLLRWRAAAFKKDNRTDRYLRAKEHVLKCNELRNAQRLI